MLKVFKSFYEIIWADGEREELYYDINTRALPILSEVNMDDKTWNIKNFEEAYDFFHEHPCFYGYYSTLSLFNKPIIHVPEGDSITVKNFMPFKVIKSYEDITNKVSIKDLANDLTADDFCRFLKDRQINFNFNLTK